MLDIEIVILKPGVLIVDGHMAISKLGGLDTSILMWFFNIGI